MRSLFCVLLGLFGAELARASVPPSYYIAERIAKRKAAAELQTAILQIELLKPGNGQEGASGAKLWQGNIFYNAARSPSALTPGHWPLVALLLEPDTNKLMGNLRSFGIPMNREEDLVNKRARADAKANPEAEIVFYKKEETLSVKRWEAERLAWQIAKADASQKFLVEKDSFNPLALIGPCPDGLGSSFLGGNEACALRFQNDVNGTLQIPSSVTLRVGDRDVLIMKINRVILNPSEKVVKDLVKNNQETVEKAEEPAPAFYSQFLR